MNNIAFDYSSKNISFQSRFKTLNLLKSMCKINKIATKGHLNNEFYKTNLNDSLRNPTSAYMDAMEYLAIQTATVHNFGVEYLPRALRHTKEVLKENPVVLKERLNKEFETLKPTKEKLNLFRGIANISDKEYETFKNYKKGSIQVPDKGFSYMSRYLEEAQSYAVGPSCRGKGIIFEIEIPPKSRISELEGVLSPSQASIDWRVKHEIVTPAGSYYEVVKDSEMDKDGVLHVFLKYLNRW